MTHPAVLLLALAPLAAAAISPGRGISETLAEDRAAKIRGLRYELSFHVPEAKTEPVRAAATIRFTLAAPAAVVLDFDRKREDIHSMSVPFEFADGHILIPASATKAGENAIRVEFTAGDEPLNRNDEFLYTLFVPARAHYAFPCFDQPSLKARYSLTLEVPPSWQAVANGAATRSGNSVTFAETEPLPTYLFAFAAGKFRVETATRDGRTFRMFHRETDAAKVARNRETLFDLHARALAWLEEYTAIPYPWGQFDFVLIPSFQFGGMEHAGAILYNSSSLMLDATATQNQLLGRASVIAHETAHMWFGDLVTMRWFNDVWMKEVLANFMAAKIVNPSFPEINHDLRFLLAHYPAAYEVDRTAGSNPIRQKLDNLEEAGSLYGAIIYEKAPIVMRQLETIMGERGFRDGMRDYLKAHAFGNATWLDLVKILEARNPGQVAQWSHAWVEERGRPEIATEAGALRQRDPLGRGVVWPQRLQVTIGYSDKVEQREVALNGPSAKLPMTGHPLYIIPNGGGIGYGLFRLDAATLQYLLAHIEDIADPLTRGSAWVDLWENLLDSRVTPAAFLETASRAVLREADEQNTQRILSYMVRDFWLGPRSPHIEGVLREGLAKARTSSQKSAWFNAYRDVVLTPEGLEWLERVWRRDEKIEGLTFAETDEIEMAMNLALREVPHGQEILAAQLDRTKNPDRKARFAFVMPALSADPKVREQSFERFRDPANRRHEPWVLDAERFLNHPLRESHARRFVRPALDLLPEIQRTGDIFFPKRWMDATLGGHRSKEAAATVRAYLAAHPELPQRLRWVVLSAADELFREAARR
jgi:aminopeptidase N